MLNLMTLLLTLKNTYAQAPLASTLIGFEEPKTIDIFDGATTVPHSLKTFSARTQTASSEQGNYPISNVVDGKNSTAWVGAENENPLNMSLTFEFPLGETQPDVIKLVPGYLKSDVLWKANHRVSKIRLRFLKGDEYQREVIEEVIVELHKENGIVPPKAQYIQLHHLYLQHMGFLDFQYLEMTILEIDDQGIKYKDTCISEIAFYQRVLQY